MWRVSIFRRTRRQPEAETSLERLSQHDLLSRFAGINQLLDDEADDGGRAMELDALTAEILRRDPGNSSFWYDRGMFAKWRRDWPASLSYNLTALDLLPADARQGEAAAWNLGIAATALHDWPLARRAWTEFGIPLPPALDPNLELEADFGQAPVRLNADPRFVGEPPLLLDGQAGAVEVVWGRRVCPTRIRIENVPTPETGHRFGDIVLHDGDPVGTRRHGDREVSVFNEIALWQRSPHPTLTATLTIDNPSDVDELAQVMFEAGGAAEDWTTNMRVLCRACSEGSPDGDHHDHTPGDVGPTTRTVGISGSQDTTAAILTAWANAGPGRSYTDLTVALP